MKKEIMVFVLLNHWGRYDYCGTEVVGIYRDRADVAKKKLKLELTHIIEARSNEYVEPCFYTVEEKRAVI